MNRTSSIRDVWHPQTRQDREAILQELHEVLASPHFCNSKRYPALLQYIVEHTLDGKSDQLKERTLGVEVFSRSPAYDTNTDTVVRYTAGEVRKRLSLYYHELDRETQVQISLPAGSYIPEFLHGQDGVREIAEIDPLNGLTGVHGRGHPGGVLEPDVVSQTDEGQSTLHSGSPEVAKHPVVNQVGRWLSIVASFLIAVLLAGLVWRYRVGQPLGPVEDFWAPLLQHPRKVLVCSGGSIFKEGNFSGVVTAGKDIPYPFVSGQTASAIALLSALVDRSGGSMELQFSASTPLNLLREQPVILLGGYNNQWTMRLLNSMPFHFAPEPGASILDSAHPGVQWTRDQTQPYSSADDFALVARFRDTTTDSWVVVLAGVGRNGTEAAAQFVTSPHYMQLLRDQIGADFGTQNVEAVLKINVIEGKTGAPAILTTRAW